MAIDFQRIFHTGVRVRDLGAAMDELGTQLGLTWAEPRHNPAQGVWTPERGAHTLPLEYVYSCEGPQHIELLMGPPGTIWDGSTDSGAHHLGVWVDDVAAETDAAIERGWVCAAAQLPPDDGYGVFTYIVPPTGLIIELVDAAIEPAFDRWWAAGLANED